MVLFTFSLDVKYAFNLMTPTGYKVLQNVTLVVGAGVYEEILFIVFNSII